MAGDLINGSVSLNDLINNFLLSYTGPDKLIPEVERTDVIFYAKRSIQEFNYETYYTQEGFTPPSITDPVIVPKLAEDYLYTSIAYYMLSDMENPNPSTLQKLILEKREKLKEAKSRLVFTNFN
jgi:hypothetical protein